MNDDGPIIGQSDAPAVPCAECRQATRTQVLIAMAVGVGIGVAGFLIMTRTNRG